MKKLLVAIPAVLSLAACGPGVKVAAGKQAAAQSLYAASAPTKLASTKAASPIDLTGDLSWSCPEGGTAKLSHFAASIDPGLGGASVAQKFDLEFSNCGLATSEAGNAVYNGALAVAQSVVTSAGGVKIEQSFKGSVRIQGAFDDFLEADVVQRVDTANLGLKSSVAMELKGSLKNSSGSYAFDEAVNVTGGSLAVDTSRQ